MTNKIDAKFTQEDVHQYIKRLCVIPNSSPVLTIDSVRTDFDYIEEIDLLKVWIEYPDDMDICFSNTDHLSWIHIFRNRMFIEVDGFGEYLQGKDHV